MTNKPIRQVDNRDYVAIIYEQEARIEFLLDKVKELETKLAKLQPKQNTLVPSIFKGICS